MWFLLMRYKRGQFMAIPVSAAGMVVPKKGGCVPDFLSLIYIYIYIYICTLPALSLQEYT